MKKIIFIALLFQFATSTVFGQFYNDGAQVTIQENALVHIQGDFINQGGEVANSGLIEIGGNWQNTVMTNPLSPGLGTVELVGTGQNFGGDFPTLFNDVVFQSNQIVTLSTNIGIGNSVNFNDGIVELNENVLHILNPLPNALTTSTGGVRAETTGNYGFVRWDIGEIMNLLYSLPFINASGAPINIDYTLQSTGQGADGYVLFSTYGTDANNAPLPNNVSNIEVNGNAAGTSLVDRFWIVNAVDYTVVPSATLGFTYDIATEIGGSNTIDPQNLSAIHWDETLQNWSNIANNNVIGNSVVAETNDQYGNFALFSGETTAVKDLVPFESISLFPNPTTDNFTIEIDGSDSDTAQLLITDMLGKIVYQSPLVGLQNKVTKVVDTANWPSGLFTVIVQSKEQRSITKLNKI